jgi:transposase
MFIRHKQNKSGSISIQVIDKSTGKYKVLKTIGSSMDQAEIELLCQKAQKVISELTQQPEISFNRLEELQFADTFINAIQTFSLVGPELILGKIFDEIGFNKIEDELFRHLVITRLVYPVSKLKTTDYLFKYQGVEVSVYSIYRYLDKLKNQQLEAIKQISLDHTLKLFENKISIVFYDVTTLYFEARDADDFRKMGFSKDGKHSQPQIVLGLLVSEAGYPLDYDLFEGDKYEGDTLVPIIEHFITKHKPEQLIVVADAGLLSNKNIQALIDKQYQYILGARIKNESSAVTKQILAAKLEDGQSCIIKREDGSKLVLSFKKARAINDKKNRTKGIESIEKKVKSGKLTKQNINNKGYNKYLMIEGETKISVDYKKYEEDNVWDGLKGYRTNTTLSKDEVIKHYHQLWAIEKTFRISKSDLEIRPIYHHLKRRIEAHICIAFVACKIYKELERQLKLKQSNLSPEKVIDILKTIYKVSFETPFSNNTHHRLLIKTQEQKSVLEMFNLTF